MLSVWQACAVPMFLKHFGRNKAPERGPQSHFAQRPTQQSQIQGIAWDNEGANDLALRSIWLWYLKNEGKTLFKPMVHHNLPHKIARFQTHPYHFSISTATSPLWTVDYIEQLPPSDPGPVANVYRHPH